MIVNFVLIFHNALSHKSWAVLDFTKFVCCGCCFIIIISIIIVIIMTLPLVTAIPNILISVTIIISDIASPVPSKPISNFDSS